MTGRHRVVVAAAGGALLLVLAAVAEAAIAASRLGGLGGGRFDLVALGAVLAASMQLHVELPEGGDIPVAPAAVVGLAAALAPGSAAVVVELGLLGGFGLLAARTSGAHARFESAWLLVVAAAAVGSHAALDVALRTLPVRGDAALVLQAAVAGCIVMALSRVVREPRAAADVALGVDRRVDAALLCAAALLALAEHHRGLAGVLVAAVPVLVIRFSFGRYAAARRTYNQAVRALSVVPEVAGLASLGHGERTAELAQALAVALGLTPAQVDEIVTAARLHHIGTIAHDRAQVLHRGPDREVGAAAAEILQETGFLAPVAELVRATAAHDRRHGDVRVAVIRVASSVDELVHARTPAGGPADEPTNAVRENPRLGAALLIRHPAGIEHEVARSMLELLEGERGHAELAGDGPDDGTDEAVVRGTATTVREHDSGHCHGQQQSSSGVRSTSGSGDA